MLGLVADPEAPDGLRLAKVDDPVPGDDQALIEVRAVSLNHGEVAHVHARPPGTVHGWDYAGVVRAPAADGSGPAEGTRVAGYVIGGAWAQLVAAPTRQFAVLPDAVSLEDAATLPVAGMTAVRALDLGGNLLGRRVLVTGAAGGVGSFAVQLASRSGAHVTGVVRGEERARYVRGLGADQTITELSAEGDRYDLILEGVGGDSLAAALARVAPRGLVVNFGNASNQATTFAPSVWHYWTNPGSRLHLFQVFDEVEQLGSCHRDLRLLGAELAAGRLAANVAVTASWREAGPVLAALVSREVLGKGVLIVD